MLQPIRDQGFHFEFGTASKSINNPPREHFQPFWCLGMQQFCITCLKCFSQSEARVAIQDFNSLRKVKPLLQNPYQNISGISCDFTCSSSVKAKNVSVSQWLQQPSWIFNQSETYQHFCRSLRGIYVVSLLTQHSVVMKKESKM